MFCHTAKKEAAVQHMKETISVIEVKYGSLTNRVHSDGAGELTSIEIRKI